MFEGNYTTIRTVIENIQRDTEYDHNLNLYDVAEWTWKAMDLIGAKVALDSKETEIEIEDHVGELPFAFKSINGIRLSTSKLNAVAASDDFFKTNWELDSSSMLGTDTYKINNKFIFTSFKEGLIQLSYNAIKLDDKGFPLVPDETRYLDAVEAYIRYKMDYRMYRSGLISRTIYEESKQHWFYTCKSAFNKMVTPNVDKAEALRKQLSKMLDNRQAHNSGFRTLGIETVNKIY